MIELKQCALALAVAVSLSPGFSCADDDDPKPGPTQEEMQEVAAESCARGIMCGYIDAISIEECTQYQIDTYQDSPECVVEYYFDECLTTQTCEEIEHLELLHIGDCLDERDETNKIQCDPF